MRRLGLQEPRPYPLAAAARILPPRRLLLGETAVSDEETRVAVQPRRAPLAVSAQRQRRVVELVVAELLRVIVHQVPAGLAVQSSNDDGDER